MKKAAFYAKRWLLSPRELSSFRELKRNEQLSVDALTELNWMRRKAIVNFAFENNAFYRRKYQEAGFSVGDLKEPSDFDRLPILEKDEIRESATDMISEGYVVSSLRISTTGGSTGTPLKTYQDPEAARNEISWRMLNWWGCDVSDNSAYLYRAVPTGVNRFVQTMLLWPTHRNWLAALDMSAGHMERFYRQLVGSKPGYIVGYVGAVDVFANFLEQHNYGLVGLKAVWTTSAPLTESKRRYLQGVFKCPVYTQYGSCEFYWIAAECCQQDGMHIANDIRHVDVVDADGPLPSGEYGDLLVTDLKNYAFPLIRYRLGDRGRLLSRRCDCGKPFALMDYVKGRVSDKIYLPTGEGIPGEYWTTIFDDYTEQIKSFYVHQAADYSVTVYYEPFNGVACDHVIDKVFNSLTNKTNRLIPLKFISRSVDVNDNGKTRFIRSEVHG